MTASAATLGAMSVENNVRATRLGGITGAGFRPGVSGNPGGRPKALARRVRELVGDSGELIVGYMLDVLRDDSVRTADRLEAAKWLADRGFGKAVQAVEIEVAPQPSLDLTMYSTEDLETMIAILERYEPGGAATEPAAAFG